MPKRPPPVPLLALLLLSSVQAAHALQIIEARDGVAVEAVLSMREPTRIRIDGSPITNYVGNIYSSTCEVTGTEPPTTPGVAGQVVGPPPKQQPNPDGELVVQCDVDKGEIYVRPVGSGTKPVNLFISSQYATYTLLLKRSDTPADTIVLRDRTPRPQAPSGGAAGSTTSQSQHVRSVKGMLVAMASDRAPGADLRVQELDRKVILWAEVQFTLVRQYEGRGLLGERYQLVNTSDRTMVLAEQEFDREGGGVLAVSIEHHNLRPGEATTVYVIRRGGN